MNHLPNDLLLPNALRAIFNSAINLLYDLKKKERNLRNI